MKKKKLLIEYKSHNTRIMKLNYKIYINEKKYVIYLQINLFLYLLHYFFQKLN